MSNIEVAAARLKAALDHLESIIPPLTEAAARSDGQAARIAELSQEREGLLGRLATVEEDAAAVAATNEEIEDRLDSAIGEIRAALGR